MAGQTKIPTRITSVTASDARPKTEREVSESISKFANALQGEWGSGQFDGGVSGEGCWNKRGYFWDFVIRFSATGSVSVRLPFVVAGSVVESVSLSAMTSNLSFVQDSDSVVVAASGDTILRGYMIPVGK